MEKRRIIELKGHRFEREHLLALINPSTIIEKGFSQCGCGSLATIATPNEYRRGFVRGEPIPYLPGHNRRKTSPRYLEVDRGYKSKCWIWKDVNRVHRALYELKHGPIPAICRQRACINPNHLEAVTNRENVFRMYVAMVVKALAKELEAGGGVYTDLFALYRIRPEVKNARP